MNIEITLSDYLTLQAAAEFGVTRAEGFVNAPTVNKWKEVTDRLAKTPLPSAYATKEECDAAFVASFAADCAQYGSD